MAVVPALRRLDEARRVIIAGCGGGFDVYSSLPIALSLLARGASVTLANLSFSRLEECDGERLDPVTWKIGPGTRSMRYFPEKWLAEWLSRRSIDMPVYAFVPTGVDPLSEAYRLLQQRHPSDLIVLVDGGTDSVMLGDEPGLGTVVEDAVSVVAACAAAATPPLLAVLGFGIDHFHGVSHHAFLENVARLSRAGGYLGTLSLVRGTPEADAFLDLVEFANWRQPTQRSIVCNSIASALRGEFGDFHATSETGSSELFINPLMSQYWFFDAPALVGSMAFAPALIGTRTHAEAGAAIKAWRAGVKSRPRKPVPL
jgi:hypothetical protein